MDYNELKDKIQKNIKEDIAISNMKKEISMNKVKDKKVLYTILSSCAVFFICGMIATHNNIPMFDKEDSKQGSLYEKKDNENVQTKKEIHINKIKNLGAMKLDADIKTKNFDTTCFTAPYGIRFGEFKIPKDMNCIDISEIYIKGKDSKEYNILNNYENCYYNDYNDRSITIAFSDTYQPLRDYYLEDTNSKKSIIENVEMTIYQYKEIYMTSFTYQNINFDVETEKVTEDELIEFLQSVINSL